MIGVVGDIFKAKAQDKAAAQNTENAQQDYGNLLKQVDVQEVSQASAATQTIFEADRDARATKALAQVGAGEAGVAGVSVEALMGDIDRKMSEFKTTTNRNLANAITTLQQEKASGKITEGQRETNVQASNPFATGLTIVGQGLGLAAGFVARGKTKTTPLDTTN